MLKEQPTSSRNQNTRSNDMHPRHPRHKLSTSEDHSTTAEDVIDEVEHDENAVSVRAVSDLDELQRCVCVWDSEFSDDAQDGHQSDLER